MSGNQKAALRFYAEAMCVFFKNGKYAVLLLFVGVGSPTTVQIHRHSPRCLKLALSFYQWGAVLK